MLVEMNRRDFETLDDAALIWACVEPTILKIRGRSPEVKVEVSRSLNDAQQALLMFQVLYGHARGGVEHFFSQLSYMLSRKGVWSEFKGGASFFGDDQLLNLLEDMEVLYSKGNESLPSSGQGWNSSKFSEMIDGMDARLMETLPVSLGKISTWIRSNPELFVQFAD